MAMHFTETRVHMPFSVLHYYHFIGMCTHTHRHMVGWTLLCCCHRHCNSYLLDDALNHTIFFLYRDLCIWLLIFLPSLLLRHLYINSYSLQNIDSIILRIIAVIGFSYARIWLASKTLIVGVAFYKRYANGTQWAWSSAHACIYVHGTIISSLIISTQNPQMEERQIDFMALSVNVN